MSCLAATPDTMPASSSRGLPTVSQSVVCLDTGREASVHDRRLRQVVEVPPLERVIDEACPGNGPVQQSPVAPSFFVALRVLARMLFVVSGRAGIGRIQINATHVKRPLRADLSQGDIYGSAGGVGRPGGGIALVETARV